MGSYHGSYETPNMGYHYSCLTNSSTYKSPSSTSKYTIQNALGSHSKALESCIGKIGIFRRPSSGCTGAGCSRTG